METTEIKQAQQDPKNKAQMQELQMTSSTISSLASPVDSGVQLLDSESELTSVMSSDERSDHVMTKSDIANQNNIAHADLSQLSKSVPNYFDKFEHSAQSDFGIGKKLHKSLSDDVFEMEHPIIAKDKPPEIDLMNISLNSYELLDYTQENKHVDQMHVSMSEEVNETLKVSSTVEPILEDVPVVEEQIVFRRQRKKKSKSDTPKKRVSFHEDILNSTRIDDIHINLGFITHESDVELGFFQRGFMKKPDVVKGRYSWAAEGDAPFSEKPASDRETKSDLYLPNHSRFYSSSSSSNSSSLDDDSEENAKKEPKSIKPKSSCLKKNNGKKYIDTNVVEEEVGRRKKSESNLLDTNIFGSLKNILNFSSSVPLMAERGVPEGQEDVAVYSTSLEADQKQNPVQDKKLSVRANLKLTASEGFYPNYRGNQNLPANVIICDSNVYEHKGISYSSEYDEFQKTFEQQPKKPKSSTVYQMILKEFNFFRRKAKEPEPEEFEIIDENVKNKRDSCEVVEEEVKSPIKNQKPSTKKFDWPDNETVMSDLSSELQSAGKHLNSPKRKVHHYSQSPFKKNEFYGNMHRVEQSNSKASLITRFLKNVTVKKMLDVKAQKKKDTKQLMSLYVKGFKFEYCGKDEVDWEIEKELSIARRMAKDESKQDEKIERQLRREIFMNQSEKLLNVFPVRSAYYTNGSSKPLSLILTDTALYISSPIQGSDTNSRCNHFLLSYTDLNTILIGPNLQTLHFSNYESTLQCVITTGCANITREIVTSLEMAMRRDLNQPQLAAVKQLEMRDMANLRRAICKQTSVHKDEEYFYYSIVNIQDFNSDIESTPLGPNKEGPLMFKTADMDGRWETAYFILKAGVLYMFSSSSQRVPLRVLPLINGSCQGASRTYNCPRPHTFQVIIEGKILQLAAPDEYVVSEWLQCFVTAASGGHQPKEKTLALSCSLLMTSEHILTVREAFPCFSKSPLMDQSQHQPLKGAQVLSCAAICDLVSFRLPSNEQSWCILEFSCREVHECSGDWILYFSTNMELESFIVTLEMLWGYSNENGESFPLSTIPKSDPLSKKCVDVFTSLNQSWPPSTVHIQFL